jgi:hypothetical protein
LGAFKHLLPKRVDKLDKDYRDKVRLRKYRMVGDKAFY